MAQRKHFIPAYLFRVRLTRVVAGSKMPARTFADLPVELIFHICSMPPTSSILLIARLSKACNRTVTPLLYERLNFKNMTQAYRCFSVLESSERNLASFVKFIAMPVGPYWPEFNHVREAFHHLFVRSILRMHNLQEFNCLVPGQLTPDLCLALCKLKFLQSIKISLPSIDELEGLDMSPLSSADPTLPCLHTLDFTQIDMKPNINLHPAYEHFISSLIRKHSHQLRIINVQTEANNRDYIARLLPPHKDIPSKDEDQDTFPLLDAVTTKPSFLNTSIINQFKTARSITLSPPTSSPPLSFPHHLLPHLQSFTGSSQYLKPLLDPQAKRPIHTLRLNGAFFRDAPAQGSSAIREVEWPELFEELEALPNSYIPVRHLAFYCQSVDFKILPVVAPYLCTLETLLISLSCEPKNVSGAFYHVFYSLVVD